MKHHLDEWEDDLYEPDSVRGRYAAVKRIVVGKIVIRKQLRGGTWGIRHMDRTREIALEVTDLEDLYNALTEARERFDPQRRRESAS